MEYIEGTGKQWVRSGIILDGSTLIIELTATFNVTLEEKDLLGSVITPGIAGDFVIGYYNYDKVFLYNKPHSNVIISTARGEQTREIRAVLSENTRTLRVDDSESSAAGYTPNNEEIVIFRGGPSYIPSSMKLHDIRMYQDGRLAVDAIPVVKDEIACLYDRVSRQLMMNQGDGDFIAGPEKNNPE